MTKYRVETTAENYSHRAEFDSIEEVNEFISFEKSKKLPWGRRGERWKQEKDFDEDETIENSSNKREVDSLDGSYWEYKFPADYTYEISDISEAYEKEQNKVARINRGKQVRIICENIMNSIIGFNMEAGRTSRELDILTSLFSDILILIQNYRPFQAKKLIAETNTNELFTQEMKDEILSFYPSEEL